MCHCLTLSLRAWVPLLPGCPPLRPTQQRLRLWSPQRSAAASANKQPEMQLALPGARRAAPSCPRMLVWAQVGCAAPQLTPIRRAALRCAPCGGSGRWCHGCTAAVPAGNKHGGCWEECETDKCKRVAHATRCYWPSLCHAPTALSSRSQEASSIPQACSLATSPSNVGAPFHKTQVPCNSSPAALCAAPSLTLPIARPWSWLGPLLLPPHPSCPLLLCPHRQASVQALPYPLQCCSSWPRLHHQSSR